MTMHTKAGRTPGSESDDAFEMTPRERVLVAAEHCFMERGYAAVTLRDIASEVGIKHASLYHHFPGGKEELFVEVVERSLAAHRSGLSRVIRGAGGSTRSQLHAVSKWLLSQSPMDLVRMTQSDMPALPPEEAGRLSQLTYDTVLSPVQEILRKGIAGGQLADIDPGLVAGGLVGMIESLFSVPDHAVRGSRTEMGRRLVDCFVDGLKARAKASPR